MLNMAAVVVGLAATFSDYPAFLKRDGLVEAYTDRGPIVEIIVRCPTGTGILSFSKIDRRFCSSKHNCYGSLRPAVLNTCG